MAVHWKRFVAFALLSELVLAFVLGPVLLALCIFDHDDSKIGHHAAAAISDAPHTDDHSTDCSDRQLAGSVAITPSRDQKTTLAKARAKFSVTNQKQPQIVVAWRISKTWIPPPKGVGPPQLTHIRTTILRL